MDSENIVGITVVIAIAFVVYIVYRNQQQQMPTATLPMGHSFTPTGPPVAEQVAISSLPIIGPAANYTVVKAGNAIAGSAALTKVSQLSVGHSANQAGVLEANTPLVSYSQVGSTFKHVVEFWNW